MTKTVTYTCIRPEINVDYILMLVQQHRDKFGDRNDKEIKESIARSIDASPSLRNKNNLIEAFIESVTVTGSVDEQWKEFIEGRRDSELESIIESENLNPDVTRALIREALRDGYVKSAGTTITKVPPGLSFFPRRRSQ